MDERGRRGDPAGMSEAMGNTEIKRLERSRSDRMVAGVCGGLARYFDIHPAFYRIGFVVLTLLGGAGVLLYIAAALVIPDEGREDSIATNAIRHRRERPWQLAGVLLVGVALVALISREAMWPHGDAVWVIVLLAGAAILWGQRGAPTTPAVDATTGEPIPVPRRRFRPLRWLAALVVAFVILASAAVVAAFGTLDVSLSDGVGDRVYRVGNPSSLDRSYELGIGNLRLDLRDLAFPPGRTTVKAHVGIGSLRIVVPEDARVRYRAEAKFGEVRVFGQEFDGHNTTARGVDGQTHRALVLDAKVGAGKVTIERAVP
jgi:phage shock protein PspC (stress-responsive transcriptional regulator)